MANVNWVGGFGDFTDRTSWSTNSVPGASDAVHIDVAGSEVVIEGDVSETVQSLNLAASTGLIIDGGSSLSLSSTLTNLGQIDMLSGAVLNAAGSIDNNGTIGGPDSNNPAAITIGTVTSGLRLTGTGTLTNLLFNGSGILENVSNHITGTGGLEGGITFTNDKAGVLDANGRLAANGGHPSFFISTGNTVTNAGILEATAGGALTITDTIDNINQGGLGGEIEALGTDGAFVSLNGATISGGTLVSTGAGSFEIDGSDPDDGLAGVATFDGSSSMLVNDATIFVSDKADLFLKGAIENKATILLEADQTYSNIDIDSATVTLSGAGSVQLSNSGVAGTIDALQAGDTLVNDGNSIVGTGVIGDGRLVLDNFGTIDASVAGAGLAILLDPIGMATSVNGRGATVGKIETTAKTDLALEAAPPTNPDAPNLADFTNNGVIDAAGGGTIVFINVVATNFQNTSLVGGTWEASGNGSALALGGLPTIDSATIILSGIGSVIEASDGTKLETAVKEIGAGGLLEVLGSRSYSTTNTITVDKGGKIELGGGTLTFAGFHLASGGAFSGLGKIAVALVDLGSILATGGTLELTKAVTGTGTAAVQKGASLEYDSTVVSTVKTTLVAGGDTLILNDASGFKGGIGGFAKGDILDIGKFGKGTVLTYKENAAKTEGTLTLKLGTATASVLLFGQYIAANFAESQGTHGDTLLTYAASKADLPVQLASPH